MSTTSKSTLDHDLQLRGFFPEPGYTLQYIHDASPVTVLTGEFRLRITLKYPTNGYWQLKEYAEFPNRPAFHDAFLSALDVLTRTNGDGAA